MRKTVFVFTAVAGALATVGVVTAFIGCTTSTGMLPMPGELIARGTPAGADTGALRRGRALAVTECASCHRFYWPHEYTPGQWSTIAEQMGNLMSLSESQAKDLKLYFMAASRAAQKPATIRP